MECPHAEGGSKRRTRVASIFPNTASCLRLVSALLAECDEEWLTGKPTGLIDVQDHRILEVMFLAGQVLLGVVEDKVQALEKRRLSQSPPQENSQKRNPTNSKDSQSVLF